ncbi:hypothetical protein B0T19DRAFT_383388 [Cercophora scortea]|uniref:DUF676 domain-containing protein n=1 Tax=Cercophora scortea TaxID=314031 RepID=A0AAE0IZN6_9PEZI|nr:hypothetical protein B0T19DRAFT_383388 [Cercophora scortea]
MDGNKRILLLCFIHGFKGDDDTFGDFPKHLEQTVANNIPDHHVTSVVYPKYETKGELEASTAAFLEWLKEQVMNLRKAHLESPWPPNDRHVGVVLIAHSMGYVTAIPLVFLTCGGFIASDSLFLTLDAHRQNPSAPLFPLIHGLLAFDTPYNGLARSMFVYGAFSNYSKVSNVFNVMTALSAAAPATLSRLATRRATTAALPKPSSPAWKTWQLVAVRTGTVGAIAAGGVAAYMHRAEILAGVRALTKKNGAREVAQQGVDAVGQGLAYVNRGSVGGAFAWLADHFTFVGALLKQKELGRRLERLAKLQGVGVMDYYASLGENGVWSGGYFVPERTFCAVPEGEEGKVFGRVVVGDGVADEIVAHMNMFKPEKNKNYERMASDAARLVVKWFEDESEVVDDVKFAEEMLQGEDSKEVEMIAKAVDEDGDVGEVVGDVVDGKDAGGGDVDESPLDIAAAASLVPLPDDDNDEGDQAEPKQAYLRHLFGVAQQTGSSIRSYLPSNIKIPSVDSLPKVSMPNVSMPSLPGGISFFSSTKKTSVSASEGEGSAATATTTDKPTHEPTEASSTVTQAAESKADGGEKGGSTTEVAVDASAAGGEGMTKSS